MTYAALWIGRNLGLNLSDRFGSIRGAPRMDAEEVPTPQMDADDRWPEIVASKLLDQGAKNDVIQSSHWAPRTGKAGGSWTRRHRSRNVERSYAAVSTCASYSAGLMSLVISSSNAFVAQKLAARWDARDARLPTPRFYGRG